MTRAEHTLSYSIPDMEEALYARMELMGMERWETLVAAQQGRFRMEWDSGGAVWYWNEEQVLVWGEEGGKFVQVGEINVLLKHFL